MPSVHLPGGKTSPAASQDKRALYYVLKTQTWTDPVKFQVKKKINIFSQSKRSSHVGFWISFLIPTEPEQWWLVNRSYLLSRASPRLSRFLSRWCSPLRGRPHSVLQWVTCPLLLNFFHQALPTGTPLWSLRACKHIFPINSITNLRVFKDFPNTHLSQTPGTLRIARMFISRPKGQDYGSSMPIVVLISVGQKP